MANNDEMINELNKADKIGDIIEGVANTVLGVGSSFLIHKAVKNIYTPKNLPEKILMYLGEAALSTAVTGAAANTVHDICHPFSEAKKEQMVNSTLVLLNGTNELAASALSLVQTTSNEGDLLCKAIYETVDVPDVGVDIHKFIEDVSASIDIDEEEGNDNE